MQVRRLVALVASVSITATSLSVADEKAAVGAPAPGFTLPDTQGKVHSLADFEGKFVVLEWVNYDCPFVQKHYRSGNMPTLQATYRKEGVVWLSVCSSAPGKQGYFEGEELTSRIAREKAAPSAYLIDAEDGVEAVAV